MDDEPSDLPKPTIPPRKPLPPPRPAVNAVAASTAEPGSQPELPVAAEPELSEPEPEPEPDPDPEHATASADDTHAVEPATGLAEPSAEPSVAPAHGASFAALHSALAPEPESATDWLVAGDNTAAYTALVMHIMGNEALIGGVDAVVKLQLSGLHVELLAQIWDRADAQCRGFLDARELTFALKLIAMIQHGAVVTAAVPSDFCLVAPVLTGAPALPPLGPSGDEPSAVHDASVEPVARVHADATPAATTGPAPTVARGRGAPPPTPAGAPARAVPLDGSETSDSSSAEAIDALARKADGASASEAAAPVGRSAAGSIALPTPVAVVPPARRSSAAQQTSAASASSAPSRTIRISQPVTVKGVLRSHTEYHVTTLPDNVSVQRRYSDFEWLRERLVRLYPYRIIPQLPAKQFAGRFEDVFIENRMRGLEHFLSRLVERMPPIRWSDLEAFLTEGDEKVFTKLKKDKADKLEDEFAFHPLRATAVDTLRADADTYVTLLHENVRRFVDRIKPAVEAAEAINTQHMELITAWRRFGEAFGQWASPAGVGELWPNPSLCPAAGTVGQLGIVSLVVAEKYERQYGAEELGFVGVLQDILNDARSLAETYENAQLPFEKHAGSVRKAADARAKLDQMRAKGAAAKEIAKQETLVEHHESKLEDRRLWCGFVRYCIIEDVHWFSNTMLAARMGHLVHELPELQAKYAREILDTWRAMWTPADSVVN